MASKKEKQSSRSTRKCAEISRILLREEMRAQFRKVSDILKKPEEDRSDEEQLILEQSQDTVKNVQKRAKVRELSKTRKLEIEDPEDELKKKCIELANIIQESKHLVIYTGAGISTAASIPDYRGPNGVWTLLQQGIQPLALDLSDSVPTYTHMGLVALHNHGLVKYIVSQNCDGLHVRSGFSRSSLSEVHGNMYLELCTKCSPTVEYFRLFDVTERTGVRKHKTSRCCHHCGDELRDSIVHFGEKGDLGTPHNWDQAAAATDKADVILCLGSSLKVLRKYPCLWHTHKPPSKRAKLCIVNLQWTPKDDAATLKINGRCDQVLKIIMDHLGIDCPQYTTETDPAFYLGVPLKPDELETTTKKVLVQPAGYKTEEVKLAVGPSTSVSSNHDNSKRPWQMGKDWKGKRIKRLNLIKRPTPNKRKDIKDLRKMKQEKGDLSLLAARSRKLTVDKSIGLDKSRARAWNGCGRLLKPAVTPKRGVVPSKKSGTGETSAGRRITRAHLRSEVKKELLKQETSEDDKTDVKNELSCQTWTDKSSQMSDDQKHSNNNVVMKEVKEEIKDDPPSTSDQMDTDSGVADAMDGVLKKDSDSKDGFESLKTGTFIDEDFVCSKSSYYRGLEAATDGTVALSKDSEDSLLETVDKSGSTSVISSCGSLHSDHGKCEPQPDSSKNIEMETAQDLSITKFKDSVVKSTHAELVMAPANGLPHSSMLPEKVSKAAKTNKVVDYASSVTASLSTPNDTQTTGATSQRIPSNNDNLHLLSLASAQVRAFPDVNKVTVKEEVPGTSTLTSSVGPSSVQQVCSSTPQPPVTMSKSIQIPISHIKAPSIISSSSKADKHLATSQTPGPTKMITMTVSEYMSSITTKVATPTVTTTSTCPVHGLSPKSYVLGSPTHSQSSQAVQDSSVIRKQLMSPSMPAAINSNLVKTMLSPGARQSLPFGNQMPPFLPAGYRPNFIPMSSPSDGRGLSTSPAKATITSTPGLSHMQLPIQLPQQPPVLNVPTISRENTASAALLSPKKPKKKKSKKKPKEESPLIPPETPPPPLLALPESCSNKAPLTQPPPAQAVPAVSTAMSPAVSTVGAIPNSNDPQMYKFLSECLMRNIQLITGMPMVPPASSQQATQPVTTTSTAAAPTAVNPLLQPPQTVQATNVMKKPPPYKPPPQAEHQTMVPAVRPVLETRQTALMKPAEKAVNPPLRMPPPAHQVHPPPVQHQGSTPSPAHQTSVGAKHMQATHYLGTAPPPPYEAMAAPKPKKKKKKKPSATVTNADLAVSAVAAQTHLPEVVNLSGHLQNQAAPVQQLVTVPKSSDVSAAMSVSCPTIVAALGKPPNQTGPSNMMIHPGDAAGLISPVGQYVKEEDKQTFACQTSTTSSQQSNIEAMKKNIQIQNILAHLRKATPGAPLPPYMYDSKTTTSTGQPPATEVPQQAAEAWPEASAAHSAPNVQLSQQLLHDPMLLHQASALTYNPALLRVTAGQEISPTTLQNTRIANNLAEQQLMALNAFCGNAPLPSNWQLPHTLENASQSSSNMAAAVLLGSISESALTNSAPGINSTPESSLSNSASFDGGALHPQVPQTPEGVSMTQQFSTRVETSEEDISYETYLIDTSAAADEATALQQAQAAVLQQLAYTADPSDGTQTVVVMNTQDVAFLDDIECEIEIQDSSRHDSNQSGSQGATTPEVQALTNQGIFPDVVTQHHHSAATTPELLQNTHHPFSDVLQQTSSEVHPPVYTEVVPQQAPDDAQIGQLGMQLINSGEPDMGGSTMWDPGNAKLTTANKHNTILSAPGWFGKGLGIKKPKRKRTK